jgi:hypothetical protein
MNVANYVVEHMGVVSRFIERVLSLFEMYPSRFSRFGNGYSYRTYGIARGRQPDNGSHFLTSTHALR